MEMERHYPARGRPRHASIDTIAATSSRTPPWRSRCSSGSIPHREKTRSLSSDTRALAWIEYGKVFPSRCFTNTWIMIADASERGELHRPSGMGERIRAGWG